MKKLKLHKYFNVLSVATLSACLALTPLTIHAAQENVSQDYDSHSSEKKDDAKNVNRTRSVKSLRFIGEKKIPFNENFKGSTVGGLSGLRYDSKIDTWVMISDDRSNYNPARFYNARLNYSIQGFHTIHLTGVNFLKQADGSVYPNKTQYSTHGGEVPDLESINIDPLDGSIWYTSEGDKSLGLYPFVKHATRDGRYLSTLPLPEMFKVSPTEEIGLRDNLGFEGSTFAPDGKSLWVAMESPLYEDGPIPTANTGAISRITQYDRKGNVLGQYAYPIYPIPAAPAPGKFADNGVSEILAVNNHELLTIERSGVQGEDGSFKNYIRLYEIDLNGASDISHLDSLQKSKFKSVKKRLILDFNTLGLSKLDNIEGISWGPKLPNGNDSLVLVSDNNFNSSQVTQFLAFEVLSKKAMMKN